MPRDSNDAMTCSPSVIADARRPRAVVVVRRPRAALLRARPAPTRSLAGLAIDRHHRRTWVTRVARPPRALRDRRPADRDRGQHEDAIAPDHRRCRAAAGDLDLPADVLRFAPFGGRRGRPRDAGRVRPAPLRPEALGALRHERHGDAERPATRRTEYDLRSTRAPPWDLITPASADSVSVGFSSRAIVHARRCHTRRPPIGKPSYR